MCLSLQSLPNHICNRSLKIRICLAPCNMLLGCLCALKQVKGCSMRMRLSLSPLYQWVRMGGWYCMASWALPGWVGAYGVWCCCSHGQFISSSPPLPRTCVALLNDFILHASPLLSSIPTTYFFLLKIYSELISSLCLPDRSNTQSNHEGSMKLST